MITMADVACASPVRKAAPLPWFSGCCNNVTRESSFISERTISPVPSDEASSTTMSCWTSDCASTSLITSATVADSLYTGITTERHGEISALDLISLIHSSAPEIAAGIQKKTKTGTPRRRRQNKCECCPKKNYG